MVPLQAMLSLAFALVCLVAFAGTKSHADAARGESRYYLIGLYRSVFMALAIAAFMVGVSRILALFVQ